MKVILLQDIKGVGRKWEMKEVSDGYARNFLLPRKYAEIATSAGAAEIQRLKNEQAKQDSESLAKSQVLAEELQSKEISIQVKEKEGKLFGSITAKDIAKELKKKNIDIPEKAITLGAPIKETGEYEIKIKLDHGIEIQLGLVIESEK